MKRKHIYLLLAICGIVFPWYFNIQFLLTEPDNSIMNFIAQTVTTLPAKSINADFFVVLLTFFVWLIAESRRLKMKHWWVLIVLTYLIAFAFTFPFFMYLRERKLEELDVRC